MASQAVADAFNSHEDVRRQKQLQEARAAGTAAPELDAATGKMINPHNPQFITQAPWYLNQNKPSLCHQQAWNLKSPGTKDWFKRGTKDDVKTKFPKGACENCGATTHSKKDCVERPRAVGAAHNGKNLMPDEYINTLELDYEGKRDRWNGFQPEDYKEIIDQWTVIEEERRKVKAAEMEERAKLKERFKTQKRLLKKKRKQRRRQLRRQAEGRASGTDTGDSDTGCDSDTDTDTDSDSDASDDEDLGEKMKDFDKTTATVPTKDDKLRTTTRNLRIREDTAKYLLNLDVNSAFYDPKSRSMRDNPLKHLKEEEQGTFRGDNYVRSAGDAKQLTELTIFAWEAYKHGEKVHDFAQPTQALKMWQVYKERSANLKEEQQKELFEKYGGENHMDAPRELIYAQNDNYVEYARDGRIIKGRERALQKSKYEEDIILGNHHSSWGSWYCTITNKWGFACCHQTMKNAYCVPLKGNHGEEASALVDTPVVIDDPANSRCVEGGDGTVASSGNGTTAGATDAELPKKEEKKEEDESSDSSSSSASGNEATDDEAAAARQKAKMSEKDGKRKAKALKGLTLSAGDVSADTAAASSGSHAASSSSAAAAASSSAGLGQSSKLSDQRSSAFGHVLEDVTEFDESKVAEAMEREKKRRKLEKKQTKEAASSSKIDEERNRKYNSVEGSVEISPEEFEAYRRMKMRSDDPMAKFL
eukprot:TRINITY_DN9192_c0_g1_i1.p1 TRINITY_DN9192_c0_g1~~TRINITY_DN9192_c0_g1_i1.p1  ORF type:complete len:740 (+),score=201.04 TRINITY_DN9192_c0_g1_i1:111-2222(+)